MHRTPRSSLLVSALHMRLLREPSQATACLLCFSKISRAIKASIVRQAAAALWGTVSFWGFPCQRLLCYDKE